MKVRFAQEDKNWMSAAEYEMALQIAKDLDSEDEITIEELAQMTVRAVAKTNATFKIYDAEAWIAGNARADSFYREHSGRLDVWISFIAYNRSCGCYEIGAYLTDIYHITGITDQDDVTCHMYINASTKE